MKKMKSIHALFLMVAILGIVSIVGCAPPMVGVTPPTVVYTSPADADTVIAVNDVITAVFSRDMDPATITAANFTVAQGANPVLGAVTYDPPTKTAMFIPTALLIGNSTVYKVTIKTGVRDSQGNALAAEKVWSFTTTGVGAGPAPVFLGFAGNYVILAETAVSNVPTSKIVGNVGLSPAAESKITGFSLVDITGGALSTQVVGVVYAANNAPPTPANLTTARSNMEAAYTDASTRPSPDQTNLNGGNLGGQNLAPGLYLWTSAVTIPSDVTLTGASNAVWIFQIQGTLNESNNVKVKLSGGAQAKNVFWVPAGAVTLGTNSHFEGVILGATAITLNTGTTMNGLCLAQSAVSLDSVTLGKP